MFLQTGGGGKGIRPNQQQQQQHHQSHHQTHHPHSHPQQPQQSLPPPHHTHQQQPTHSHHPHQAQQQQQQQQHQQHHHLQQAHQATPYYSFQLSQAPPSQHQQHQQAQNNAAQASSPPNHSSGTPTSSAAPSTSALQLGGPGGNSSSSTSISRHTAANNIQHYAHPPSATAALMQPPTTTTFMTTPYLQQQYQQTAVMAAAAAAAQYNSAAGAAHSPQTATQNAQALYQTQQQHQQQQHHHTMHQGLHQPTLTHFYHAAAGAPPTPPPHLHAHHHQQHALRGVLTAAHQRQPATYLLPTNTIFAISQGSLAAQPPRTSLLATHQQAGGTGAQVSVTPLLQSAAAARGAAGGPTAYIAPPFCQPPLPMGAASLTQAPPLLATAASIAPPSLQQYGHLAPNVSASSTSLTTVKSVKERKYAIPIIDPLTNENVMDPKPEKKSTAVEAKPSTVESNTATQKSASSSANIRIVAKGADKTSTASVSQPVQAPVAVSVLKEKIDQQMQTDAIRDKSSTGKFNFQAANTTPESPSHSISASSNLDEEEELDDDTYNKKGGDVLVKESVVNEEYDEDEEEHITVVVEEIASQANDCNYDYVESSSQVDVNDQEDGDLHSTDIYVDKQIQDKHERNRIQLESHNEVANTEIQQTPETFQESGLAEETCENYPHQEKSYNKSTNQNETTDKLQPLQQSKSTIQATQKSKSNKQSASNTSIATPTTKTQIKQAKTTSTTTTSSSLKSTQKLSPVTSGTSSSTTSTPTHSNSQQQQQKAKANVVLTTPSSTTNVSVASLNVSSKKNRKLKKGTASKESQKKLKQQAADRSCNNNNNKTTLSNASVINNNIILTTDINNVRISNSNLREITDADSAYEAATETTTGNFNVKQQSTSESNNNLSGNITNPAQTNSSNPNSPCESFTKDSTPLSPRSTPPVQQKHLKTQEIVAQFLQPTNSKVRTTEEELNLQFLNSSSSACEDEEELNAIKTRLQLQQPRHEESTETKDLHFGDFTDITDDKKHITELNDTKESPSQEDTVDCSIATAGNNLDASKVNDYSMSIGATSKAVSHKPKIIKYTLEELKALAEASEAQKPPLIRCKTGDYILQLIVPRQQHHLMTYYRTHNISPMTLQQQQQQQQFQQFQHMNFHESMEFVTGKRRGQNKKHHEQQMAAMVGSAAAQSQRKTDIIRVNLSLKEEIKLSECKNAWQPNPLRSYSSNTSPAGSDDDIDAVIKTVRGILNKLTPDNFDVLMKTMTSISMNTEEKIRQVMLLIFEKTISEPNFAPTYAKFCKSLFLEIKAENKSEFTNSLISRIQEEFESNVNDADAKKLKLQPLVEKLEASTDSKERSELQAELEDQEYQFRRRAWGTVRFIGEMYKQRTLTDDRVLLCIESLLKHGCEEKLEYMCKLLTTVGHLLDLADNNDNNMRMDKIFRKIQEFVKKSSRPSNSAKNQLKISSRVRFMMQDVMDLRARTWDQPQRRGSSKIEDKSQGSTVGNYEKNSSTNRLPYGYQNNPRQMRHSPTEQRDSNNFMQKPMKLFSSQQEQQQKQLNIDVNKLKFIRGDDTMQGTKLGNSKSYMWRIAGRQPSNAMSTPMSFNSNAPTVNSLTSGNNANFKRQTNQFQALDRQENPEPQPETNNTSPTVEVNALTKKETQKLLNRLIEEVLDTRVWHKEVLSSWLVLNTKQQVCLLHYLLTDFLHQANVKRQQRIACAKLFAYLMVSENFHKGLFTQAYVQFSKDFSEDFLVDVPNGWTYVFEFIGPLLHERLINFSDIWISDWAENVSFTEKFIKAMINHFTQEFGANYARDLWHKEFKLDKGQIFFMNDVDRCLDIFVANKFQHIYDRNFKLEKTTKPPHNVAEQVERIEFLLNTANECDLAIDYINTNVHINRDFIRNLTKFFCCDYATVMKPSTNTTSNASSTTPFAANETVPQTSSPSSYPSEGQLNMELFRSKCIPLLRLCIDTHELHEISCLDAIVDSLQQHYEDALMTDELVCSVFDVLYDCEIISKESFEKWYKGHVERQRDDEDDGTGGGAKEAACVLTKSKSSSQSHDGNVNSQQQPEIRLTKKMHIYMEKIL